MKAENLIFVDWTGAGAIGATLVYNQKYRLLRVELHLSAAPTTSQNFTITRDDRRGSLFDAVFYKRDLSVGSVTDLIIPFGDGYEFDKDDELDIAYTNTDGVTWGILAAIELLE